MPRDRHVADLCSTPSGINGRIGWELRLGDRPVRRVLNAFRHQRADRARWARPRSRSSRSAQRLQASTGGSVVAGAVTLQLTVTECSTPSGINGRIGTAVAGGWVMLVVECSTPSGINGRIGSVGAAARGPRRVLNAFRHQRADRPVQQEVGDGCRCAQRLPASTGGSGSTGEVRDGGRLVLNAFRHQRADRAFASARVAKIEQCSTPSGINGRIGGITWVADRGPLTVLNAFRHQRADRTATTCSRSSRTSAQRLPASTGGSGSARAVPREPRPQVLNACRHQRADRQELRHPAPTWTRCAQRLPASTGGSVASPSTFPQTKCAQRLPASTGGSAALTRGGIRVRGHVLNAFRHQRADRALARAYHFVRRLCSTPSGINGRIGGTGKAMGEGRGLCSTPSGINGRIGRQSLPYRLRLHREVLNAFRHQRADRSHAPAPPQRPQRAGVCSTPSGINGRIGHLAPVCPRDVPASAQRLPASTGGSVHPLINQHHPTKSPLQITNPPHRTLLPPDPSDHTPEMLPESCISTITYLDVKERSPHTHEGWRIERLGDLVAPTRSDP